MIMSTKEICKRGLSMTISLTLGNTRLPLLDRLPGDPQQVGQTLLAQSRLFAQVVETLLKFHGCDLQNKWLQRTFDAVQDSKEFPVLQPKEGYNLTTAGCSGRFPQKMDGR